MVIDMHGRREHRVLSTTSQLVHNTDAHAYLPSLCVSRLQQRPACKVSIAQLSIKQLFWSLCIEGDRHTLEALSQL